MDPRLAELQRAAEQGDPVAQCELGIRHEEGRGVPRDYDRAAFWYRRAAEQGLSEAQSRLGRYCDDDAEAVNWLQLAAEQGLPDAQFQLGNHYLWGDGIRRDPMAAARWFRRAADQGLAGAECTLGEMWERWDRSEAAAWYLRAAKHGYEPAQEFLGEMLAEGVALPQDPQELRKWSIAPDAVERSCPRCEDPVRPLLDGTCGSCGEHLAPPDTRSAEELGQAAQTMSTRSRSDVPCAVIAGVGLTALIAVLVVALVL